MGNDEERYSNPLDHPGITMSYANETHVVLNSADVALYFGVRDDLAAPDSYHPYHKIIIPHAVFMKMVEFWSTRYKALYDIYGEKPKTLNDFPKDVIEKAFGEMMSPKDPSTEE